jgi:hypothetical protein
VQLKNTISELHRARFNFKSVKITGLERLQHPNMWGTVLRSLARWLVVAG